MIYAVSDLHGCYDKYIKLLERLKMTSDDSLYILGDIVDRGSDGIKIVLDLIKRDNIFSCRGNHDHCAQIDFVYGDIDNKGVMTPLDGQQRLTTLFLLHWFAAKKENISWDEYSFLENFSYETRYSARDFCAELVKFTPSFSEKISEEIVNQVWFPLDWKKDPTISSMLVMLDSINEQFCEVPSIWEQLKNNAITFYFLPIKDMGLTDEL